MRRPGNTRWTTGYRPPPHGRRAGPNSRLMLFAIGLGLVSLLTAIGRSDRRPEPAADAVPPRPVLSGRVVRTHDGDTVSLKTDDGSLIRTRLFGLDAPELDQPYGSAARSFLAGLTAGQTVRVAPHSRDQYDRLLGRIFLENRPVDLEMIRHGWAWVYERYCLEPYCEALRREQAAARRKKLGLWQDQHPVPPWVWRGERRRR